MLSYKNSLFKVVFILFSFLVSITSVNSTTSITYPIANSMVLQRNMQVPIWGTATVGETVQVTFNNQVKSTQAGNDGKWKIFLDPMIAAGPLTMTIKGNNTITVQDVYVGEVWNCGGQSNMDTRLSYYSNLADTISSANNNLLRYIDVRYTSMNKNVGWHSISPSTAGGCSATAYFYGKELQRKLGCAVGLLVTAVGGTFLEGWLDPATIASNPNMVLPSGFTTPGSQYNEFVAPVIPYAIKGTIFMHGEQNAGDVATAPLYGARFEQMIKGWRDAWGQGDFPFYYGQITMYDAGSSPDTISPMIQVREGQQYVQKMDNVGMTVNIDLTASQWHFPNKYEAGHRLALQALTKTYDYTGFEYSGPVYNTMGIQGKKIRLLFDHAESGISSFDNATLTGFMIEGADNVWYSATTTIDGNCVVLTNSSVTSPKRIFYAYGKSPKGNMSNKDNLPASQFRTDKIEGDGINQTLSFSDLLLVKCGISDFDPGATTTSGLPITYESTDTNIATITDEGLIHLVGSGNCYIKAYQAGNSTYRPSIELNLRLIVSKAKQEVVFDSIPDQVYGGDDFVVTATASSELPISYSSNNATVATISGDTVHIVGAGSCTINAAQYGNSFYSYTSQNRTFQVVSAMDVKSVDVVENFVLPNPIRNKLIVKSNNQTEQRDLSIINNQGSVIYNQSLQNNNTTIDVSFLLPGIYYVKVSNSKKVEIQKIIKL
ncbi:MAG: sialate O-acetylesterase [Paludibacter sp.]|nr:sialate O-acetylesterase [Paludibacter sp.]